MDVQTLRDLLMEIGTEQFNESIDERRSVTVSGKVYVIFGRIVDVIGVWDVDDGDRTINLASTGNHDKKSITLDVSRPAGTEVLVSYVDKDGLNDKTAQTVIDWAYSEVLADIQDFELDLYDPSNPLETIMRTYWQMLTLYNAYLLMNNVNFIQSDGNISLFNYQQMSKLWGEGMSTDALFQRLLERIERVRRTAFNLSHDADVAVNPPWMDVWKDPDMLTDWIHDIHDAHSRYSWTELARLA